MKKLLLLLVILISQFSFAQEDALVFFADKENVAAALANPNTILSQASLDRKQLQGTAIDARDVPLNETYKATVSNSTGITVLAKSKWLNAVYVRGSQANINNLSNLSFVTNIEFMNQNLNRPFQRRATPDKFANEYQERVVYNYGAAENQTTMLGVDFLHENDFTGQGITVAFLDNGYPNFSTNPAYATLRAEGRYKGSYDFVSRQVSADGTGTHGASTVSDAAGFLPGQFVGTAPNASYYLFVTEDDNEESPAEEAYWVEGLERADSLGVYVTNTSLGYQDFDNPNFDHQYSDLDGETTLAARGSNIAFDKGMINVVSAGNDGGAFNFVATPADAPGSFTIGAVDSNGDYVSFSSVGPTFDGRVKPDVMAKGSNSAVVNQFGEVTTSSGTSFSSPIMAGAVASFWQARPQTSNAVIIQLIRESADRFNNPTDEYGYGIPDFSSALIALQTLGVQDQFLENQFALYPNPISSEVNISFPKSIVNATFKLYNVLGSELLKAEITSTKNKIDVSALASGMYVATVTANGKSNTFKLIKE